MVCIEKRPHILYGRSSAPHFRYLTCLLDRGHIKIAPKGAWLPYQICEIIKKVVIREARKGSVGNLLAFCVNGVWKAVTFVFEQLNIL